MAFIDMYAHIKGIIPKMPLDLAKKSVIQAYQDIRRQNLWSFQCYDSNWITPAMLSVGTCTLVQGLNTVLMDATAAAAIDASIAAFNPINQRQFRNGIGTICNILSWDSGSKTLTIDRGYPDPVATPNSGLQYQVFQSYYPAPFQDHLSFVSVRDMTNFSDLILDNNIAWLDEQDPQRTYAYQPTHVVPRGLSSTDPNNTATYQFPVFELWGIPQTNRAYQLFGIRRGPDLARNTDTLPPVITEEAVLAMAKYYAFEWAEANKGAMLRNQGPDYKFLMGETTKRYTDLFRSLRRQDRENIDLWFRVRRSSLYGKYFANYNTISGTAFPGAYMG